MRFLNITRFRSFSLVLAVSGLFWAAPVFAQGWPKDIGPGTIQTLTALTTAQQQDINDYTEALAKKLTVGETPEDISKARQLFFRPYHNTVASTPFRSAYAPAAVKSIAPGMKSSSFAVRLNTIIIAARLEHKSAIQLGIDNLADKEPAIRFWAAAALAGAAGNRFDPMGEADQAKVLGALKPRLAAETVPTVLESLLEAAASLPGPAALDYLLTLLDERANAQKARLTDSIRTEIDIVSNTRNRLLRENRGPENTKSFQRLVAVSCKYAMVSALALNANATAVIGGSDVAASLQDMVGLVEDIIKDYMTLAEKPGEVNPSIAKPLKAKQYPQVMLNLLEWAGEPGKPGKLSKEYNVPEALFIFAAPPTPVKPPASAAK